MVYLKEHLAKYPLMQTQDVLKLHLQGILGPAHAVNSFEIVYQRTNLEYQSIMDDDYPYELKEEISTDYVRIYLKPYFEKKKDFAPLVKAFVLSSQEKGDVELFREEVRKLINEENRKVIEEYLSRDNYLISHSPIYRENYHPHYLVIHRKYLDQI